MATASASRMLKNRRMPAAFFGCFLGKTLCHAAWSTLSIQFITGVSRYAMTAPYTTGASTEASLLTNCCSVPPI